MNGNPGGSETSVLIKEDEMSSIQGIQAASPAIPVAAVTLKAPTRAQAVSPETPAQEAQETTSQTKTEAAKGDQQAARKLAQSTAGTAPTTKAPTSGEAKVNIIA